MPHGAVAGDAGTRRRRSAPSSGRPSAETRPRAGADALDRRVVGAPARSARRARAAAARSRCASGSSGMNVEPTAETPAGGHDREQRRRPAARAGRAPSMPASSITWRGGSRSRTSTTTPHSGVIGAPGRAERGRRPRPGRDHDRAGRRARRRSHRARPRRSPRGRRQRASPRRSRPRRDAGRRGRRDRAAGVAGGRRTASAASAGSAARSAAPSSNSRLSSGNAPRLVAVGRERCGVAATTSSPDGSAGSVEAVRARA